MVQLMSSGKRVSVKLEVEESLEEELASLHKKRSKLDPCLQEGNVESGKFPISPSLYNPLDEPSPLGLRLKKSPSFLDLIQMKLSQQNAEKLTAHNKKDSKGVSVSGVRDKLKASNFPAAILRIGSWEYKSRYEGDLVAKCYFAKHKLVWEVLDGGLKNKIEIQWSDIIAIKANYPDDVPGTLDVVLARQPLFFKETNPQPRKHTLWQATSDFTGGQASVHRQHFLQCPPGLLGKHFEKLIHCDPRLNFLSKQPEILLESPYFESRISGFDGLDDAGHSIELKSEEVPTIFRLQDQSSPSTVQSPSCINEQDFGVRASDNFCQGTPSPSSVREAHVIEEIRGSRAKEWDMINFPELNASMSMTDLVDHIGNCITEQMTASVESQNILEEITQYLLNDSQHTTASDEKSLMSRVNSLYCLLQKDSATEDGSSLVPMDDVAGSKLSHPMSRKDSIGDLLLNLPRIASMPKFLFNTLEDSDIKSRANKAALLAFKKSIFDPKSALTNWIDVVPVCNFSGITCNKQHHRVQEINLSGCGLGGKISPFLSNLTGLRHLKLNENHFYGAIPPELSSLRRLTMFIVMENYLTGSLPPSFFSNCTNLMVIDASVNNFTGQIPDQIGDCPDLWSLNLYNNQFTDELPASLANTSLYSLDVGYNLLSGELPSDLVRKWPYLGNLYLSYNNMTSHDNNTNLYPFFAALRNCSNLSEVGLVGMQLGGRLPTSIAHPTLRLLDLQDNHISGPIPREIGNLTNITMLSLTSNLLNGTIPEEISRLSMLEQLFLSHNFFSSRIPATLSKLNHLGLIDLSSNKFSGEIPPSLGDLGQLRSLFLNNNLLSGSIPPKLLNCRNLNMLDLSYNQLTGRIPPEIAELREIRISINLSHNHLQGLLPIELSKLENVLEMDLSSNNLSGNIFPQISSCIAVTMINFSHNNLQGQLPDSLGDLRSLQVFDVSRNNISGKIPRSLSKINLTFLNLSFNDFNGMIPSGGIFNLFTNLSFLGNPSLCGVASSRPICPHKKHWFRSRMFLVIFVIVIVVSVLLSTVCCMIGIRHIKLLVSSRNIEGSRRKSAAPKITQNFPRLTYKELSDATGGFDEHKLIGTGSYGRVYKGVLPDDTSIAVKVLHLQSGNSIKSFNRECQVLKRIRHRNLIRIITACSLPDFKALVLPYMANGSLDSRLYPHSESSFSDLTLTQRVSICSDIAEGMAYLHHHSPVRVIHCDLKPSNVLLNDDMTALVSDFGIARLVTTAGNGGGGAIDNMGTSTANILTGSVGYIAPEYGFGSNTSFRGDVYSFGVVVLEMVTRKRPTDDMFVGGLNLQKWVKNHYHGRLEKVVDSCLVSDSRDQSAEVKRMWEVAIEELTELGILCTQETPSNRPTMLDAADDLDRLKRYLSGDSTVTFASSLGISSSTLSND